MLIIIFSDFFRNGILPGTTRTTRGKGRSLAGSEVLHGEKSIHAAARMVAGTGAGFNDNDEDGSDWGGVALLSSDGESEPMTSDDDDDEDEDDTPTKKKTRSQPSVIKNDPAAITTAKQKSEALLATVLKAEASMARLW